MIQASLSEEPMSFRTGLASLVENWRWVFASGIAFVVLGAFAIGYSVVATLASVFVLGWVVLFSGVFQAAHAFRLPQWGGFILELLTGLLYLAVGAAMTVRPDLGAVSLTLLIGAFFLASGLFRIILSISWRPILWGWMLTNGLVTLLLGILILLEWPASSLWIIGMFLGIDILFAGTWLVMLALAARKWEPGAPERDMLSGTGHGSPIPQHGH